MVMYLSLEAISERFRDCNIPDQIPITKNFITIGNAANNDVVILLDETTSGYLAIYKGDDEQHYLRSFQLPLFVNDTFVSTAVALHHKDRIRIGDDYVFCFIQLLPLMSPPEPKSKQSVENANKTAVLKFHPSLVRYQAAAQSSATESQKLQPPTQSVQKSPPSAEAPGTSPSSVVQPITTPSSMQSLHETEIRTTNSRIRHGETVKMSKGMFTSGLKPISKSGSTTTNTPQTANTSTNITTQPPSSKIISPPSSTPIAPSAMPTPPVMSKDTPHATPEPDSAPITPPAMIAPPIATKPLSPPPALTVTSPPATIPVTSSATPETLRSRVTQPLPDKTERMPRMIRQNESTQSIEDRVAFSDDPTKEMMDVDAQMTLMWQQNKSETEQSSPLIIAPSNGQVIPVTKDKFVIGRSSTCDLCLLDDYISRQHLELAKIALGFLLKNIGKNEVIVEKKTPPLLSADKKIILEEKILKPGESTVLLQEATIILGNQILYFFNEDKESVTRERKCKFYTNLAGQKAELLDAAQLQKLLTPPHTVFEDIHIGVWFKYLAINDLSGDFFLYHKIKDILYVCLGDVSGHGAAAALLAGQISGIFKILAEQQKSAEEIVHAINTHLLHLKQQRPKQSLYALINVLQITANGIEMSIAGNSVPPLYYKSQEKKLISLNTPSTPIGLFGGDKFKIYWDALEFRPNDLLIMFTDGVTEAEMSDDTLLEYPRVRQQIEMQIQQQTSCEDFLDSFLSWLKQKSEIRDDLSIVLLAKI